MEFSFDNDITVTTVKTYTKFFIRNIDIRFNEPARVDILLKGADCFEYETVEIPVEIYTGWQYDQMQIVDYCKTYLQNKYTSV
jgi:hypothetical protein